MRVRIIRPELLICSRTHARELQMVRSPILVVDT